MTPASKVIKSGMQIRPANTYSRFSATTIMQA
jgi:hypothetical protein